MSCLHEWAQAYAKLLTLAMQGIEWRVKHIATASPPEVVVFSYTGKADTAVRITEKGRITTKKR